MNEQTVGKFLHVQRRRALVVTPILLLVFVIVILMDEAKRLVETHYPSRPQNHEHWE